MDTSKVIRGVVNSGRYTVTAPIVKEDYGLKLKIEGVELPSTYEVDFSNNENSGTSVTMIGNSDGVLIPHQFIDTGKDIFAFLYVVGINYGRTVYKFRIPNKLRPDRTNIAPTPEEQSVIDQAISALNEAVEQTSADVASADQSAQSAQGYAEQAETAKTNAQTYANNAQTSANNASASASQASTSATASAQSASQSAQIKSDVEGMVDDAQGYAESASQSASASANSASQASGYAQSASASAQSASGYASNAQTSANTASNKASEASTSASTASQKATEASQSATTASNKATEASGYATASQTAQGLAESARDSAVQAKTDAESAKADAESARDEAQQAVASIIGALAEKAPVITDTASGAIASFPDGADDIPLKSLIVDINPVQDLHGQDAPYPAGGGKNLASDIPSEYSRTADYWTFPLPLEQGKTYTIWCEMVSGTVTGYALGIAKSGTRYSEFDSLNLRLSSNGTVYPPAPFTVDATYTAPVLAIYAGSTQDTLAEFMSKVRFQVEEGSAKTTFAPYSNICPISGWDAVTVTATGGNLFNVRACTPFNKNVTLTFNDDGSLTCENRNNYSIIPTNSVVMNLPNGAYTISTDGTLSTNISFYASDDGVNYAWYANGLNESTKNRAVTINKPYVQLRWQVSANSTDTMPPIMFEYGSTYHSYEPYTGRSITINLGQTVYGGKLDVLSGELVIDRAMVDLGTLSWWKTLTDTANVHRYTSGGITTSVKAPSANNVKAKIVCSSYETYTADKVYLKNIGIGIIRSGDISIYDPRFDKPENTAAEFKEAMNGVMLCYEVANPIEIQLSANQINSLLGVNNIWADTGDTTCEYRADTKLYIEKLTQPEEDDMIADSAITSGQFFMVGNTLYRALANIASGATITVGTNAQRVSLSDALNLVNA